MSDYDWSRFSARIDVKAELKGVYAAWTTRANLEHWFLRVAEFTEPGGEVRAPNAPIRGGDRIGGSGTATTMPPWSEALSRRRMAAIVYGLRLLGAVLCL